MKLRIIALSIALAAATFAANGQAAYKGNDVFIGIGAGVNTVFTPELNTPAPYGQIQVGRYITPVWGVRGVIGGPFQNLDKIKGNAYRTTTDNIEAYPKKLFGELFLDGIVNFSNIFAEDLAKFDLYMFVGPSMNLSTVGTELTGYAYADDVASMASSPAPPLPPPLPVTSPRRLPRLSPASMPRSTRRSSATPSRRKSSSMLTSSSTTRSLPPRLCSSRSTRLT